MNIPNRLVIALCLFWGMHISAHAQSGHDESRGKLLYTTHCNACHTAKIHWREQKLATDLSSLNFQVRRWQASIGLSWSEDEIMDATNYLNAAAMVFLPLSSKGCCRKKGENMFSILRTAAISLLVLSLAACSSVRVGQDFDLHAFNSKIERGVSTQNLVRTWLGEPTSTGINVDTSGERFEEWTYYSASGRLSDMAGAKVKTLQIKFDEQGIVRGYSWSNSN